MTNEQKEAMISRYAALKQLFYKFKKALKLDYAVIDNQLLQSVTLSWILDEKRHKDFHGINVLQKHKRAAYLSHWIVKIKPIHSKILCINDKYECINELFGLFTIWHTLAITRTDITIDFVDEFIYTFRYRNTSPESMFMVLDLLKKSHKI